MFKRDKESGKKMLYIYIFTWTGIYVRTRKPKEKEWQKKGKLKTGRGQKEQLWLVRRDREKGERYTCGRYKRINKQIPMISYNFGTSFSVELLNQG